MEFWMRVEAGCRAGPAAVGHPKHWTEAAMTDVLLGEENTAGTPTTIFCTLDGQSALIGEASAGGAGLYGTCGTGTGVFGLSDDGIGVKGQCSFGGTGVVGESLGTGVHGKSTGSASGVFGESQTGIGVSGKTASATASGVSGLNPAGGVGVSGTGLGAAAIGVKGTSSDGIGVRAEGKTALVVHGPAAFSRSGIGSVRFPV
jgi:hypothetical protein